MKLEDIGFYTLSDNRAANTSAHFVCDGLKLPTFIAALYARRIALMYVWTITKRLKAHLWPDVRPNFRIDYKVRVFMQL